MEVLHAVRVHVVMQMLVARVEIVDVYSLFIPLLHMFEDPFRAISTRNAVIHDWCIQKQKTL